MTASSSTVSTYIDQLETSFFTLVQTIGLLDEREVDAADLGDGWTAKAVLAHVAYWDDFQTRRMQAAVTGASAAAGFPRAQESNEERLVRDRQRDLESIMADAEAARRRMIAFVRTLDDATLAAPQTENGQPFYVGGLVRHMIRHTYEHGEQIQRYCGSMRRWSRVDLRAFLDAQHTIFMDSIGGLDEETMLASQVCGIWTIRDVLAHVLSWNEICNMLLYEWPASTSVQAEPWAWHDGEDMDSYNARLLAAKESLDLIAIADGLTTIHRRNLKLFDRFSDEELAGEGLVWEGKQGELACFYYEIVLHEIEHAEQILRFRAGEPQVSAHLLD